MLLVPRSAWGARSPSGPVSRLPGPVTSVTFHYEGPRMGLFDHNRCPSIVRGIQSYHMDHNHWLDVAYNALVCYHGYTFEGRWLGARSAANGTNVGNGTSYAICGMWGEDDPFTDEARHAYLETRAYFMGHGAGPDVHPHRFWFNTACPGAPVVDWIAAGFPDVGGQPPMSPPAPTDPTPTDKAIAVLYPASGGIITISSDGGVFNEEGSEYHGGLSGTHINGPVVAAACSDSGHGYWMVCADGGIFAFGDAHGIQPYVPLFAEYAAGARRITSAVRRGNGLVLLSNLGERFALGV